MVCVCVCVLTSLLISTAFFSLKLLFGGVGMSFLSVHNLQWISRLFSMLAASVSGGRQHSKKYIIISMLVCFFPFFFFNHKPSWKNKKHYVLEFSSNVRFNCSFDFFWPSNPASQEWSRNHTAWIEGCSWLMSLHRQTKWTNVTHNNTEHPWSSCCIHQADRALSLKSPGLQWDQERQAEMNHFETLQRKADKLFNIWIQNILYFSVDLLVLWIVEDAMSQWPLGNHRNTSFYLFVIKQSVSHSDHTITVLS